MKGNLQIIFDKSDDEESWFATRREAKKETDFKFQIQMHGILESKVMKALFIK